MCIYILDNAQHLLSKYLIHGLKPLSIVSRLILSLMGHGIGLFEYGTQDQRQWKLDMHSSGDICGIGAEPITVSFISF